MKQNFNLWKQFTAISLIAILAFGVLQFVGTERFSANSTPQTLPFTQNWTNINLITVSDDWAGVPGIIGYRGDDPATTTANIDPQTLTADLSQVVDVNANLTNPDTFASGGVSEFEIANPVVGMQGSGTADAPHLVLYLNTTGQSNINLTCNVRDIDGSADDAAQQFNVQYRVGGTGVYTNVTGGYFADVTTAATATQVTPVNVTLPSNANNQALVEIRLMTTNAAGNDENIGIDDISVTGTGGPVVTSDAPVDFNGDGKTDYAVVRNVGGGSSGQLRWFYNTSGTGAPTVAFDWGLNGDTSSPADYDGDQKDDIAIWRPGSQGNAAFYILQSQTNTVRIDVFGLTGDIATVQGDYDGDGKDDVAVWRRGASAGAQSTWFYRGSLSPGNITFVPWGVGGDFVAPGDYNGDGKHDFVIFRPNGGAQATYWRLFSNGTNDRVNFGLGTDFVVSGDFDGDAKADLAVARPNTSGGTFDWYWRPSAGGADRQVSFGSVFSLDTLAPGDYDGDGKTDVAVWRNGQFIHRSTTSGAVTFFQLGSIGDTVPANSFVH